VSDTTLARLETLLAPFDATLGAGFSAVLYGPAARGAAHDGRGEVSVLIILDDVAPATLARLGPALVAWHKSGYPPPFLMSRREWGRAADAFPVELAEITAGYRMLRGSDPVAGATVDRADLRLALERDLAADLMRLRQAWAMHAGAPADLGLVARHAIGPVVALLRGLLALTGRTVPADHAAVIREAAAVAAFDPAPCLLALEARHQRRWKCPPGTFEGFLAAVDRAAGFVDRFHLGDR
jgi:hypothetical protein